MADVFSSLTTGIQTTVQYLGHILGVLVEIDKKLAELIEIMDERE